MLPRLLSIVCCCLFRPPPAAPLLLTPGVLPASASNVAAYYARIGLDLGALRTSAPEPGSLPLLRALLSRHCRSIPFENLDVARGRPVDFSTPALFEKLVDRRRGGYCYEQNFLLYTVLHHLSFEVSPVLCRVRWNKAEGEATAFTHIALLARIGGGTWLVDAGMSGNNSIEPIRVGGGEQVAADGTFRAEERGDGSTWFEVEHRGEPGRFLPVYNFRTVRWETLPDFEASNYFSYSFPEARMGRIPHRPFVGGFVVGESKLSLVDKVFTERDYVTGQVVSKMEIESEVELLGVLKDKFGLEVEGGWFEKFGYKAA